MWMRPFLNFVFLNLIPIERLTTLAPRTDGDEDEHDENGNLVEEVLLKRQYQNLQAREAKNANVLTEEDQDGKDGSKAQEKNNEDELQNPALPIPRPIMAEILKSQERYPGFRDRLLSTLRENPEMIDGGAMLRELVQLCAAKQSKLAMQVIHGEVDEFVPPTLHAATSARISW